MQTIKFSTSKKFQAIDITEKVEKAIKSLRQDHSQSEFTPPEQSQYDSKLAQHRPGPTKHASDQAVLIYAPHATAAIVINESWDPNIGDDLLRALDQIVPLRAGWQHDRVDGNAAAHIKAAILGPSELIPLRDGKLALGRWQQLFFLEFDGPRSERKVFVSMVNR